MHAFNPCSRSWFRMTAVSKSRYVICCAVSLLFLVGCVVPNQAHRRGIVADESREPPPPSVDRVPLEFRDCQAIPGAPCVKDANGHREPQRFYLAYIEFDDMGELWSIGDLVHPKGTSQLDNALDVIARAKEKANSTGKPLDVVTFIHGWHNNATAYDENHKNLARFKTDLQELAINDPSNPVVVGVFIAWRGQFLSGDPFLTYWNRRDTAVRVGGPSMTEALFQLMFATKGVLSTPMPDDSRCEPRGLDPNAHFVAIGHSFGARVLEHAMGQPLLAMVLEQNYKLETCAKSWDEAHRGAPPLKPTFQWPADLIVFLNPANDAFETKSMIEAFKRSGLTTNRANDHDDPTPKFAGPLLVSMTSKGDWATRKGMPIAQGFSTLGITFRKYDDNRCSMGQLDLRYQTWFLRQSDGNIGQMHSHEVKSGDVGINECNDYPYLKLNVGGQPKCFRIKERDQTETNDKKLQDCYRGKLWNDTPFWVVGVDDKIIPNHTDIFQPGTIGLLRAIARLNSPPAQEPTMSAQTSAIVPQK